MCWSPSAYHCSCHQKESTRLQSRRRGVRRRDAAGFRPVGRGEILPDPPPGTRAQGSGPRASLGLRLKRSRLRVQGFKCFTHLRVKVCHQLTWVRVGPGVLVLFSQAWRSSGSDTAPREGSRMPAILLRAIHVDYIRRSITVRTFLP